MGVIYGSSYYQLVAGSSWTTAKNDFRTIIRRALMGCDIAINTDLADTYAEYILRIFSAFNGFIFLGELPDFYSIIGMSLIVGSGLYIIFRENVKDKLVVSKTTLRT